jgi:hypothetical protein
MQVLEQREEDVKQLKGIIKKLKAAIEERDDVRGVWQGAPCLCILLPCTPPASSRGLRRRAATAPPPRRSWSRRGCRWSS